MTQIDARPRPAPKLDRIALATPAVSHGAAIHKLIASCKPLDVNSLYAYLLLCAHHADTCVIAHLENEVVGFVSAYKVPARADTVFVWQVAVDARARGTGLASAMLHALLARPVLRSCTHLETTVSPSNSASRRLFHALARKLDAPVDETLLFAESDFGGEEHECEMLIRIGPFQGK